jgi:hypothetical protein
MSLDLTTNTKCVFSTPTQLSTNITQRPEKFHDFTSVIIPPPPGFKPPVLNHSSHILPHVKTKDTFSVLSEISVDSKTNSYSSVNSSILECAALKDNSNYINHIIEPGTKETDKSKAIPLTNIYTVSSANNKAFQISSNILSTTSPNTVKSSFNSCTPVTRGDSYSSISQIKDTVALRNTDACKRFDTKTNETQEYLDNVSKSSMCNTHNYVSKIVVQNKPIHKNPFLSNTYGSHDITHSANLSMVSLSSDVSKNQISDEIKTVRFADNNSVVSKKMNTLSPRKENLSLPNLANKSLKYIFDSSSEDSDFDLNASYTSLNPFISNSIGIRNQSSSSTVGSNSKDIEPKIVYSKCEDVSDSKKYSMHNSNTELFQPPDIKHDNNKFYKYNANKIKHSNPFHKNKLSSNTKLNTGDRKAMQLGQNFFTSLSNPQKSIMNNKELLNMPTSDFDVCFANSKSVHERDSLINTTNMLNLLPPMNKSTTATNVQRERIPATNNSDMSIHLSDFTATEDLSKLTFPSSGQTKLPNEPQGTKHNKTAQDRYAALKDLDDMFKTTVMSEGILY